MFIYGNITNINTLYELNANVFVKICKKKKQFTLCIKFQAIVKQSIFVLLSAVCPDISHCPFIRKI
jgi:hypothetical protein